MKIEATFIEAAQNRQLLELIDTEALTAGERA